MYAANSWLQNKPIRFRIQPVTSSEHTFAGLFLEAFSDALFFSAGREVSDWETLSSRILEAALDWLSPNGKRSPRSVEGVTEKAEALCSALNLLRFLLLREGTDETNHTGVSLSGVDTSSLAGFLLRVAAVSRMTFSR